MRIALLLAWSLLAAPAEPDARTFAACRAASRPAGACTWRHGVLSANDGYYSSRIVFDSGQPQVIAVHQPGLENPDEFAPAAAAAILARSPNLWEAEGDYLACPLPWPRLDAILQRDHLGIACLAGARDVVARRRF